MQIPSARVHVLLLSPNIFRSTVCVQVNADKYYLEWIPCTRNNQRLYSAHVSTEFMYQFRLAAFDHGREMIRYPMNYFHGEQNIQEREQNFEEQRQQLMNVEAAAVVDSQPNEAAQYGEILPTDGQAAATIDTASASETETLVEVTAEIECSDAIIDAPVDIDPHAIVAPENGATSNEPVMDAEITELLEERFAIPFEIQEAQDSESSESDDGRLTIAE